jgi:rSAM/selenodomain-associated transferase 1
VTDLLDATVAVIAKAPEPGKVKTRLCPPCTPEQAARFAAALLEHTLAEVAATPVVRRAVLRLGEGDAWIPDGFDVVDQRGAGLAERLVNGIADLHATDGRPVVVVGCDTPAADRTLLCAAVEPLVDGSADATIGMTLDGGYWGIGLASPDGAVFDGVPMSTATTGARQLDRFRAFGLRTQVLATVRDVDRWDDAVACARELAPSALADSLAHIVAEVGAVPVQES